MDLAAGLILGIVYVAAPGPIGVETLRQGIFTQEQSSNGNL
jgi:hypothetical protein